MTKYLIMKCVDLDDQYECEADRTPITLTDDWRKWVNTHKDEIDYAYAVYEFIETDDEEKFTLVKEYNESLESGMALVWYHNDNDKGTKPTIVQKWPDRTRNKSLPKKVQRLSRPYEKNEDYNYELHNWGYVTWIDDNDKFWVYGEYNDNSMPVGY